MPNLEARLQYLNTTIDKEGKEGIKFALTAEEITEIAKNTKGFSGADLKVLCSEAALNPLRNIKDFSTVTNDSLKEIGVTDFKEAMKKVKPSVSSKDLNGYIEWNNEFGSFPIQFEEINN